ncbi:MAG TPA: cytochrome c biogenesis protein CcsA [Candidatus Kapabacteria bacterium]|nr:cytochrome c biogenesis protein CcsA [Candidatus Kapabacteria bacterium]
MSIYLSLSTPVAGGFKDAAMLKMLGVASTTPVMVSLGPAVSSQNNSTQFSATDRFGAERKLFAKNLLNLKSGMVVVGDCTYDAGDSTYELTNVSRTDPAIIFPLVQGLGELGRNILFHVPMSFVAFIAFLVGTINSIQLLRKNDLKYDLRARAASAGGLLFTTLATITGSIWARFSWGTFWNWDSRETSILVLLLIYVAYFLLRQLLEDSEEKKARTAAVYNIIAFVTVPFLMFILPRITRSLHPGGNGMEAPVVNLSGKTHIDPWFSIFLWINVVCFAILFYWMRDLFIRIETAHQKRTPQYN